MKFSDLDLHPLVRANVEKANYLECTPIQEGAIPHLLQGRDIAGLAQTGTGKTAAFLLPLIDRVLRSQELAAKQGAIAPADAPAAQPATDVVQDGLSSAENAPEAPALQAGEVIGEGESDETAKPEELHLRHFLDWRRRNFVLILVPTRELAEQVYENAKLFTAGSDLKAVAVYGGTTYDKQKAAFRDGVEFVVATPGRLIDLYKEHIVDLRQVRAVVFDEADRMFDMGFKEDMKFILKRIPRERQFLVFSATLNFDVLNVAYEFGAFPVEINISKDQPKAEHVTDELFHIGHEEKPKFLLSVLKKHEPRQAIIFSNFKHNVERITKFLNDNGVPAVGISSLLTQAQRNRVMAQFKGDNDRNILVATDVAARGLDILGVDLVINYELPDDPENYVHRIGRTGRAGQEGHATSLVCDRDVDALARIHNYVGKKIVTAWLDDAELINDIKPFPSDRGSRPFRPSGGGSDRPRGSGGPRREGRDGGGRGGGGRGGPRNDRPHREGGGGHGGPRGPSRGHHQGGRPDDSRRAEGSGRGPRDQGPRDASAPRDNQRSASRPPEDRHHRDRRTGRHRGGGADEQAPKRHNSGPGQANSNHGHPANKKDAKSGQFRHGQGQRSQKGARAAYKPLPAKGQNASIGQKVTGLIKKIFGRSSAKSSAKS